MINTHAFPAVAISLWTLAAFSVATWALIFVKTVQHVRNGLANRSFAKRFWGAPHLQAASDLTAAKEGGNPSALGRIAAAGFGGLLSNPHHQEEHDLEHSWDRHEQLQRNLTQQLKRERRTLDAGLAVLASVGSTAPFVGLFGTVVGILKAFQSMSVAGTGGFKVVSQGIAAALVATAAGLMVAIYAVIAYNYFVARINSISMQYRLYCEEFLAALGELPKGATSRPAGSPAPDAAGAAS